MTLRSSTNSEPPAQSGSLGSGSLGAPGTAADDQRVVTAASWTRRSASRTARSNPISPSGGSGTCSAMSCSSHTTSCTSDSTSGRARPPGTGVTSDTHREDSFGVSTGTPTMIRRFRSAASA